MANGLAALPLIDVFAGRGTGSAAGGRRWHLCTLLYLYFYSERDSNRGSDRATELVSEMNLFVCLHGSNCICFSALKLNFSSSNNKTLE